MENLNLKQHSSQAKIIGTVVSIVGALIVTLYKGLPVISNSFPNIEMGASGIYLAGTSKWIIGAFLLATASFCLSILYIVQVNKQFSTLRI
jgi:TRAP-type mannitol/chloroaromatic compound transport system permease small subunit